MQAMTQLGKTTHFKWLEAKQDMAAFGIEAGSYLAIESVGGDFTPTEAKLYLFKNMAGHQFIGRYCGLDGGSFKAIDAGGNVYTKEKQQLCVLARVKGVLEA